MFNFPIKIEDNLNSTKTKAALSANQGRILNEKIESLNPDINIDTLPTF